jgi:hypothetical protein
VHEGQRYAEAIREYQTLEYKVMSACLSIHCCVIWSDTDRSYTSLIESVKPSSELYPRKSGSWRRGRC